MISRFRRAIEAGHIATAQTGPAELANDASLPPILALLALDEIGPNANSLRDRHQAAAQEQGAQPLFILNPESSPDFLVANLLCEFLPLAADLAQTTGDTPAVVEKYLQTRMRIILDKWGVRECRWIGESAAELIEPWTRGDNLALRPVAFRPAP